MTDNDRQAHGEGPRAIEGAGGERIRSFDEDTACQEQTDALIAEGNDTAATNTALIRKANADVLEGNLSNRQIVDLLNHGRKLSLAILFGFTVLLIAIAGMFNYMTETRRHVDDAADAAERVDDAFREFTTLNQAFLDNHQKTQRIVCDLAAQLDVASDEFIVPSDCPVP